jgi:starch-binding outer membrane protein, SusD/RagB family
MKVVKYSIFSVFIILSLMSCKNWLEILPENEQTTSQYWKTKEEVEAVLGAGYTRLRSSVEYLFIWGEARGTGINFYNAVNDNVKEAIKLRNLDILPSNMYAQWANMYQVINMANSVIKYAPEVAKVDASFNEYIMKSYLSEAYFQRALAYFYLVRTFRDVPFVTEPYVTDEASYLIKQSSDTAILKHLVMDLDSSLESAKEYFPEVNAADPANSKGRATRWAIHALLADINLWLGNYDKCITSCDAVINSGRVGLISGSNWYTNFYPGNSNESIFEIQYSYSLGQTNSFYTWFNTDQRYIISPYTQLLFEENANDLRGANASYYGLKIWKYCGINSLKPTPTNRSGGPTGSMTDQNFIIYRIADVYLMKAEAYIMENDFLSADTCINKIRSRAGITTVLPSESQSDMLDLLLKERQREFFAEGKSWFDILRVAQHENYKYKNKLIEQVLQVSSSSNQAIIRSKLMDVNSWYLPIYTDEINVNTLLVQNPYYKNLGK